MHPAVEEDAGWEVEAVLAWHDEDAKAAIGARLADIRELRRQLTLASLAMSCGFTRGWMPMTGGATTLRAVSGASHEAEKSGREVDNSLEMKPSNA